MSHPICANCMSSGNSPLNEDNMDQQKSIICAAVISTVPYVSSEAVRALHKKKQTLSSALQSLMPIHGLAKLRSARETLANIENISDDAFGKLYPNVAVLWRDSVPGITPQR